MATEKAVTDKFPWIHFMHCVAHEASLIVQDICRIEEIDNLLTWMTEAQKWFSTNKLGPLLQKFCIQNYGCSRSFIFPAMTRFAGKLLQLKRFLSMKIALKQLVQSVHYIRFEFENDSYAARISGRSLWRLIERVTSTAGPILLLLRLADSSNAATLSKLTGTVNHIKTKMLDSGNDTLEDKICVAFQNRSPELECDIASAAYVLDPQFIMSSRNTTSAIMDAFWRVAQKVLRIYDETEWKMKRQEIVAELAKFRMRQGGFAKEDYTEVDSHVFWGVAGCHAPNLRKLALILTTLPCSSGEAERNWKELQQNYTKVRNRIDRSKVSKIVFVRRFLRLKRKICFDENNNDNGFKDWVQELLAEASKDPHSSSSESEESMKPFVDHIEPGEQGKINGKEPGQPQLPLTALRKDHAAKSWLFEKYYQMQFVDKNPEGDHGDGDLEDESEWEHRVIKDVVWFRHNGYAVESILRGNVTNQSIERYNINDALHEMIRDSPYNTRPMLSEKDENNSLFECDSDSVSVSVSVSDDVEGEKECDDENGDDNSDHSDVL